MYEPAIRLWHSGGALWGQGEQKAQRAEGRERGGDVTVGHKP